MSALYTRLISVFIFSIAAPPCSAPSPLLYYILSPRPHAPALIFGADMSTNSALVEKDHFNVGLAIEDVYLDPAYREMDPFVIYRDGKRFTYSIRSYNGQVGVYPVDFDPSTKLLTDDQNVSPESHIRPKLTENCPICGERMHEPAGVHHFISGNLVEPKHRELHCNSGHKYCFSCWCDHLQAQIMGENALGCLPCPGFKCGEILDLQWAPVMLKSPDLVNKLLANRQRHTINSLGLRWCPVPKCGLLVHVHPGGGNGSGGMGIGPDGQLEPLGDAPISFDGKDGGGSGQPQSVVCANGHGFCLACNQEAHAPCSCSDFVSWHDLIREESRYANPRESGNMLNILLTAPSSKQCPECSESTGKEDGCNHMR